MTWLLIPCIHTKVSSILLFLSIKRFNFIYLFYLFIRTNYFLYFYFYIFSHKNVFNLKYIFCFNSKIIWLFSFNSKMTIGIHFWNFCNVCLYFYSYIFSHFFNVFILIFSHLRKYIFECCVTKCKFDPFTWAILR